MTGKTKGIGGHQSAAAKTTTWLTPPHVIESIGGWGSFDLDPCAAPRPQPWATARHMHTLADGDGLQIGWEGRVWLNPPYSSRGVDAWLARMSEHGRGTVLIFARTETEAFDRYVWRGASALLFLVGRLHFHYPDGRRARANSGAPSVLAAYGDDDAARLEASALKGHFVRLRARGEGVGR